VYHGGLTQLPRRYLARLRLCMRGTTDYWVNGLGGEPFFVITQLINPGLVGVLRAQIVPRLLREAPQPTQAALEADPDAVRFTLVVDREAYSPALFAELAAQRIAILTYRKHPGEEWPDDEFVPQTVQLYTGEEVELSLAERGVCLSNGLWIREVRRNKDDGTQGSIITTNRKLRRGQSAKRTIDGVRARRPGLLSVPRRLRIGFVGACIV
jgi:hypothetical protein